MAGRLRDLEPAGHFLLQAAAVLGRQFDGELLFACVRATAQSASDALETLRSKQVFEEASNGELRFVHDGLRELAYDNIETARLRELHGQAALVIEARYRDGEIEPYLGALGLHHSKAGSRERAAHYFEGAANRARLNYATEDAVSFYRLALAELPEAWKNTNGREQSSRLHEAIGELLLFGPTSTEAREHLEAAIREDANPVGLSQARRRRKLARALERLHLHAEALSEYSIAERGLGDAPSADAAEYWQEFVQIQVEAAWNLYFLGDVNALDALLMRVRPAVERFGNAAQRARFFTAIAQSLVRRKRFRVDDSALEFTQLALNAGLESDDLRERTVALFAHAFPLMLAGKHGDAEPLFADAVKGAEQVGDASLLTRVTAYFGVLVRQTGDVSRTRGLAEQALRMAEKTKMNDYIGVAHANLAWVAWRDGQLARVPVHATTALEAWGRMPSVYVFSYQWLARTPYAAYLQREEKPDAALEQLEFLLREHQQAPPPALAAAIQRAVAESGPTRARLVDAAISCSVEANYV